MIDVRWVNKLVLEALMTNLIQILFNKNKL